MAADIKGLVPRDETEGAGFVLGLVLSVATTVALGLALVWVNIERTDLGYRVLRLNHELEARVTLEAQLSVERDKMLSPYILEKKAKELGLHDARPGQRRRMGNTTSPAAAQ